MPIQAPSWTDFLNCPICCNEFEASQRVPISLGCGHTICKPCLTTLYNRQCPYDQTLIVTDIDNLPHNSALLQLVGNGSGAVGGGAAGGAGAAGAGKVVLSKESELPDLAPSVLSLEPEQLKCYKLGKKCIEDLALHLKSFSSMNSSNLLTRPMQRKLVTLVNCQLMEEEGRVRALRAARSLGERTVTELILQHQNPQQLSSNLWAAVRTRGCQFLGPAMQEEVLKLVLLALEEGSALSRKVLVMFVVQRLEEHFPQASKTSIGHVVQLLYRASCFKVSKREADSSLMQLKEEFRTYDALRREHDAQIVQIATEAGLRIAPEQWSSLLYGDSVHKSHMQSIIDKLQTPSAFAQSVQELVIALQRTSDPAKLALLHTHLQYLAGIDPSVETAAWEDVASALDAVRHAVMGLVYFLQHHGIRKSQDGGVTGGTVNNNSTKYKISLCRDLNHRGVCPRGASCTFAHSQEEVERYRARNRGKHIKSPMPMAVPAMPPAGKKPLSLAGEMPAHGVAAAMLPMSPMRYIQPPVQVPVPPNRGFLEASLPPPPHSLSPGGVHPQLLHAHHSPIARQQQPQQQQQPLPAINGMLVAPPPPPLRFEPCYNFAPPALPRAGRKYSNNATGQPSQRNPPNYNNINNNNSSSSSSNHSSSNNNNNNSSSGNNIIMNNNNNNNNSLLNHNKSFCSMLPGDVYHTSYFSNEVTPSSSKVNNVELPAQKLGGNPWEHPYMTASLSTLVPPSSKNPGRVMSTILPVTADTSFYEKKPPSNVNIDVELVKPLGESTVNPESMNPLFRPGNNSGTNCNTNRNSNTTNNSNSLIFWNSSNKDLANFVRSDSILDDDASTFDVPTGSSINSRYGPICPKRNVTSNWNNWLVGNEPKNNIEFLTDKITAGPDELSYTFDQKAVFKPEHNNNPIVNKSVAGCDSVFIWNKDLNSNASGVSTSYWSSSSSNSSVPITAAVAVAGSAHNERLKQLDRNPVLMSEDSMEGGIDSGMMSELEKNLVDIVDVWSNPDDSGIKLD